MKIASISVLLLFILVCSCKTYFIPVDSLREQFSRIDSSQFKEVAIKGPVGGVYRYKANPIILIKCVDNRGNPNELKNSPSIEMRVIHKGQRTIFYFDRIYVGDSILSGVESRFAPNTRKDIPLKDISKIEIQDGKKNFHYIKN